MGRRKIKQEKFITLRTFQIMWINHPQYGCRSQMVAEDVLFSEITIDRQSVRTANNLDYDNAMIHFVGNNMCVITRDRDIKIPFGDFGGF